uniref:DUF4346 domain-containing protein n=1 Tax=Erythrocystis saccata TaxID=2822695 RepID=A0A8E6L3W6_9FLOR|nr:hypothetical protein [Erythrocystis saccata]
MDNNFFILRVFNQNIIEIYIYNNSLQINKHYPICFVFYSCDFQQISSILSICNHIINCSTTHKFYLGKEIFKAQISMKLNQYYIQD